jgi:hypothetical protein
MRLQLLIWASLLIQTAPAVQPSASFSGTVVDALSGQPIAGASVQLSTREGNPPTSEMTSTDGRFRIGALRPGEYNVRIIASGYVLGLYGDRTGISGVELNANQSKSNARIELTPTGSISGRIHDAHNDPVANLTVQALKQESSSGKIEWRMVESRPTNDLGEFRLFWLDPGNYLLRVLQSDTLETSVNSPFRSIGTNDALSPIPPPRIRRVLEDGTMVDEATFPVYFPGTIISGRATPIEVRPAQNSGGMDFQFGEVPVHRIRGRIAGITGSAYFSGSVRAIPLNAANTSVPDFDYSEFSARPDADQHFEMAGFPAGTYLLMAETTLSDRRWAGRISVEVGNEDVSDVTIALTRNETVTGRFSINGVRYDEPAAEVFADIRLVSLLSDSEYVEGIAEKNIVRFVGVPRGDYRMQVDRIAIRTAGMTEAVPAYIESIRNGAQDVLRNGLNVTNDPDQNMEIFLRTDFASLMGRVTGSKPDESQSITIVLVPGFRDDHTRYRTMLADSTGQFRFSNVAPGDYKLFAKSVSLAGFEASLRATFSQSDLSQYENLGTPVSIKSGDTVVVDVPIIQGTNGAARP